MNVIQLRRPQALLIPDIQALLGRALASANLAPNGLDSVAKDLFDLVTDDYQFMFLGEEHGKFQSVVFGHLPVGNLYPYPTVVLFYNEGSRALSRHTRDALMDFLLSSGYTRAMAINLTGRSDAVWARGLAPEGARAQILGSFASFEVK